MIMTIPLITFVLILSCHLYLGSSSPSKLKNHQQHSRRQYDVETLEKCSEKSRSQSREEEMVIRFFFKDFFHGVYVEIGALNGLDFTNTLYLDKCMQWRGVLIEASKNSYDALVENSKKYRNQLTETHYGAVCAHPLTHVNFASSKKNSATSGDISEMAPTFLARWYDKNLTHNSVISKTSCRPMSEYLVNQTIVNFFVLDVEGAELAVLETTDFVSVHFDVIMIEFDFTSPVKNYKIRQLLYNMNFIECLDIVPRSALFLNKNPTNSSWKCPGKNLTKISGASFWGVSSFVKLPVQFPHNKSGN